MRKELIWAGIIGITVGLIIAFGAWRISSSNSKPPENNSSPTPAPNTKEFKITLDKPGQNDVVTESSVTVSGITKSLAWLTLSGEKGDYIIQAGDNGVFSQDVDLTSGVNQIRVTAFDPNGIQSVEKVVVVYSSAFQAKTVPTPTPGNTSTESAIRTKVQEKVAEALNKPKAYIGIVADIADSTIQIKTTESEIKQISVASDGITVVNIKGTNNKIVKISDIAIGDFIVAMGYVNSKSVLSAQRILITDPVTESKISSQFGKVTNDTSNVSITVSGIKDESPVVVTPSRKTDIESFDSGKLSLLKFVNIVNGDLIIYVTDSSGDTPLVRSIFRVQKAQS